MNRDADAPSRPRTDGLRAAAANRSADAIARAHRAITSRTARDAQVTFATVAAEAAVSESFLYKHRELNDRIKTARRPIGRPRARSQSEAASTASLRIQLEVITARLAAVSERNELLAAENEALRGEISDLRAVRRRRT